MSSTETIEAEITAAVEAVLQKHIVPPTVNVARAVNASSLSVDITVIPRGYITRAHRRACGYCDGEHDENCPKWIGCTVSDDLVTIESYDHDAHRVFVAGVEAGTIDREPIAIASLLIERLTGGMVQGRANASQALEDAAVALSAASRNASGSMVQYLTDRARDARAAAVEVRKEITRP